MGTGWCPWSIHPTTNGSVGPEPQRDQVRFLVPREGGAVVTLGAGLSERCELSVEIDGEAARGSGIGTRLIAAALDGVGSDQAVFASVAPGNTRSLRSFLAAGFRPIGSECVLVDSRP